MKILRVAGWSVGGLLLLLVLAAVTLLWWFDPNDYKDELQSAVRERTGRELALAGDLKLSLFPWLAVEFGPASLGNAAGFGAEPMVEIKRARLGVKLRALLSRRVEVGSVQLDGLTARLAVDARGRDNWSDLTQQQAAEPQAEAAEPLTITVDSIRITDSALSYSDASDGTHIAISEWSLSSGGLQPGQPVALETALRFTQRDGVDARIELAGLLDADTANNRFTLTEPRLELALFGSDYPKEGLPAALSAKSLALDLNAGTLSLPEYRIAALSTIIIGSLSGRDITGELALNGPFSVARVAPRDLLRPLGVELPATSGANALKSVELRGQMALSTNAAEVRELVMKLDDANISGRAGIADFDSTALRFDLKIDRLNIDDYLPPAEPDGASSAGGMAAAAGGQSAAAATPLFELPVEFLRELNARGNLALGQTTFGGIRYENLQLGVNARAGKVRLNPVGAGMYGGRYSGDINVDVSGATPQLRFDEHVSGIDFAGLFTDMFETDRIAGRGNANIKGTANGADSARMLATLNGTVDFAVNDGRFDQLDVWYEVLRARNLFRKQAPPERTGPERTDFTRLTANGRFVNGVLHIDEAVASTARIAIQGSGVADVAANSIDMRLTAAVPQFPAGSAEAAEVGDLMGASVPVRVSGALDAPSIKPDIGAIAQAKVRAEVQEQKQELKQKVEEKLRDRLKGLLGN